jgi:predicted TIM-barrel enzyme
VVTAEGMREGLGAAALAERHAIRREDIAILADVHDRTAAPADGVDHVRAARWAEGAGADALVLTGADEAATLGRLGAAREGGVRLPLLAGGGVHAGNVRRMLAVAQGVIVSRSLMRPDAGPGDVVRWDLERCRRLMAAAGG